MQDHLTSSEAHRLFLDRSTVLWELFWLSEELFEAYEESAEPTRPPRRGSRSTRSHSTWLVGRLEDRALASVGQSPPPPGSFRNYYRLLVELYIVRHVDYFNVFLGELFHAIAAKRPQILASEEKIEVRLLLESASLSEVIAQIATRKAVELSYLGFKKTLQFLQERLRLSPEIDAADARRVAELIAIRNLIVHNDAIVTDHFLIETKWPGVKPGDRLSVSEDGLDLHYESTMRVALALDKAAVAKFNL